MTAAGTALRAVLAQPGCAMAAGAYDPAVARLVEEAGFPVCYVSGSASSTAVAGFPDVGLLSFSELLANARHIVNAVELPVLCDVDTGFGNPINVARTIQEFEGIGAAGVHIEDQTFPKRCGQTAGATCIPTDEMCAKIVAAKEAQRSDDFVLVVRSDARQCEGLEPLIERCRAYRAGRCGRDLPGGAPHARRVPRVRDALEGPLVIDVPEWGRSPTVTIDELEGFGFDLGIFAVSAMRVALGAVRQFLSELGAERTQRSWIERMMTRAELDELLGLTAIREREDELARAGAEIAARARD